MDEDLIRKATDMLEQAKYNLDNIVNPMLGRARSLQEGQDLKGAYEVYKKILEFDPGCKDALKQKEIIKNKLTLRARRVYRKALISESLSLFQEAKELYQEVVQISPSDSEYYIKASDKLKSFWEN
jgi:tetratricopeptide (TPR) repeat protein